MLLIHRIKTSYRDIRRYLHLMLKSIKSQQSHSSIHPSSKRTVSKLTDPSGKQYFIAAKNWADDLYTQTVISRNRYKLAFFVAMGLAILLSIAVDGLIPLQHIAPLLVNHYQDGQVFVQPMQQPVSPKNSAEVQSELVRYVINRESYDPTSYDEQYSLITLLSDHAVAKAYIRMQSSANPSAPINTLGNHGFRTVHVDNVIFLDSAEDNHAKPAAQQTHHNLAQVDFTITNHQQNSAVQKAIPLTALIAWTYREMPNDLSDRWRDWDGLTVTRYTVEQQNLSEKQ